MASDSSSGGVYSKGVRLLGVLLWVAPVFAQGGSIAGRVTNVAGGAGIGRARVTLVLEMRRTGPAAGSPRWNTDTDAHGQFAFSKLEPGIYAVVAERDGFLRPGYRSGGSYPLVVGENQAIDGAELKLTPMAAIAVKVLDPDGHAARGATVRAGGLRACTTDTEGSCRIERLSPGKYAVEVTGSSRSVRLEPGEVRTVELALKTAPAIEIRGYVADPMLHGATTFVRLMGSQGTVTVGSDGTFLLRGVTPGPQVLTAERVTGLPSEPTASIPMGALHTEAVAVRRLDVADRNLDGIELSMASLRDIQGTVHTEDGAVCPLTGGIDTVTRLTLTPEVQILNSQPETELRDSFVVPGVAPVRNRVNVWYLGACYVKSVTYGGRNAQDWVLDLAGEGSLDITFAMGGRVSGTVVDGVGRVPRRATVTLVARNGEAVRLPSIWMDAHGGFTVRGVRPGSYDAYAWEEAMETAPAEDLLKAFAGRGTAVTVSRGGVATARLTVIPTAESGKITGTYYVPPPARAKGSIAGLVVDGRSGEPLTNARFTLQGWNEATPETTVQTDALGRFEIRDLDPGFYYVAPRAGSPWGEIILGSGQAVTGIKIQVSGK